LPAQEPVNLKRAARIVEPAPAGAAPAAAPALAAPWPTVSPPVFPQEAVPPSAARRPGRSERAAPDTAPAAAKPPTAAAPAPAATAAPPSAPSPPASAATPVAPTAEVILARGQTAFDRGNYAEAIRRAKEAMAVGAAVPGHLLVADSYYHLQRYADALREYEAALALEPSNALARRGRELASKAGSHPNR
jgi:tetratricopeptide (TPR) repeat protein